MEKKIKKYMFRKEGWVPTDGYYVIYNLNILRCISLMFIEIKFLHCHSCVMCVMN